MTLWWRRQARLDTVNVETAILLWPEWDTEREAVISQQSRRLERLDKGWNTDKPGGRVFRRLEEVVARVSAVEVDHVSARVVVGSILRDPAKL